MMSHQIQTEIIIHASRDQVWNILTDFASYPEWNPFILSIEGTLTPGGRLKNTLKNGDKKMVFRPRIKELKPAFSFAWLGSLFFRGLFDGYHYFIIEETGTDQVRFIHGENFSGLLSGPILKKIGKDTRNNFITMNEALKRRAEA
jgi:hypothetical protein